jgi:hypothetical protein
MQDNADIVNEMRHERERLMSEMRLIRESQTRSEAQLNSITEITKEIRGLQLNSMVFMKKMQGVLLKGIFDATEINVPTMFIISSLGPEEMERLMAEGGTIERMQQLQREIAEKAKLNEQRQASDAKAKAEEEARAKKEAKPSKKKEAVTLSDRMSGVTSMFSSSWSSAKEVASKVKDTVMDMKEKYDDISGSGNPAVGFFKAMVGKEDDTL